MEARKERMEQVKKEEIKGSRNTSKEENVIIRKLIKLYGLDAS